MKKIFWAMLLSAVACAKNNKELVQDAQHEAESTAEISSERTDFTVSQILVAHSECDVCPETVKRSREAAKQRAWELFGKLESGGAFAEIAREHSDCASGKNGGQLGPISPESLGEQFYSIVQKMERDKVHAPVESNMGFHIIKKKSVNLPDITELSLIGIRYAADGAPSEAPPAASSSSPRPDNPVSVTKAEAVSKIEAALKALKQGVPFALVAQDYSDHPSARTGGFLGPVALERMPETLARTVDKLGVDEFTPAPVDFENTLHIFKKHKPMPRTKLACALLVLSHKKISDKTDRTEEEALALGQKLIARLDQGEDFAKLVQEFSDGPAKQNGGQIGKFRSTSVERDLAEALVSIEVGAYTQKPLVLKNGITIVKREPVTPAQIFDVSLIAVAHRESYPQLRPIFRDKARAAEMAQQIIEELNAGKPFAQAAKEYSDHYESKERGGRIAKLDEDDIPPQMKQAILGLTPGSYTSTPVDLPLGYHIIRREK